MGRLARSSRKGMRLYGATSKDGGLSWTANQKVYESPDGHICECCHPTAYISPTGEMYAMWRNWVSGSRDMYYTRSTDGKTWATAKRFGTGTWPLNACPMDGGGLALDGRSVLHSAWRRDGAIYATAGDAKELAIGKGKNPTIAASKTGAFIAWTDGPEVKLLKPGATQPATLGEGAFPVLAASDSVYAAWEQNGAIVVEHIQ